MLASVVEAHRLGCSAACGIFPDQGSNPCPVNWQADSHPLHHQERLQYVFKLHFLEGDDRLFFSFYFLLLLTNPGKFCE